MIDPIPLDTATLCLTCNMITTSTGDSCSYCGAKGLCLLVNWLNREEPCVELPSSCSLGC
jgi:hypothetical protein